MKPLTIVGIVGRKRSGKDTFVKEYVKTVDGKCEQYNFSRPVYAMLTELLDVDELPPYDPETGEWDKEVVIEPYGVTLRHMLQTLGTDWGRVQIHEDIWIHKARRWFEQVQKDKDVEHVIFTDIRFPNEAAFVRGLGGVLVEVVRSSKAGKDKHSSENQHISNEHVSMRIYNDSSLKDYKKNIHRALKKMGIVE